MFTVDKWSNEDFIPSISSFHSKPDWPWKKSVSSAGSLFWAVLNSIVVLFLLATEILCSTSRPVFSAGIFKDTNDGWSFLKIRSWWLPDPETNKFWPGSKTVSVGNHLELLKCDWQRLANYFTQIMDNINFLSQQTSATQKELMQRLGWKLKFNLKKYVACVIINLLKYFACVVHCSYHRGMLHLLLAYIK